MNKSNLDIVTSHHLFLDNQYEKIDEDGLLSQRIFGPKLSYKCACGYYTSKLQHAEKRCPKCGVLCTDNFIRYTTFAKIVLPFPVFKPTYKNLRILKTIIGKYKYLIDVKQYNFNTSKSLYLRYDSKTDKIKIVDDYDINLCIPLSIKGIYSLYIGLYSIYKIFQSSLAEEIVNNIFAYELLVIPPESRGVHKQIKNGQVTLMVDEINRYYSQLLDLSKYDWAALELNPQQLRENYINMVSQSMYDDPIDSPELYFHDAAIIRYQRYTNKIYQSIVSKLSSKEGIIRKDFLGKSIDFCSRTHMIIDPSLKAYEIKLPKINFIKLFFIEYIYYLMHIKKINIDTLLYSVRLTESKVTQIYPDYIDEFIDWIFSSENDYHKRIVLINRQPTLDR